MNMKFKIIQIIFAVGQEKKERNERKRTTGAVFAGTTGSPG